MDDVNQIIIRIGVPLVGTPSVYRVRVHLQDSKGPVNREPNQKEKRAMIHALLSYLAAEFE